MIECLDVALRGGYFSSKKFQFFVVLFIEIVDICITFIHSLAKRYDFGSPSGKSGRGIIRLASSVQYTRKPHFVNAAATEHCEVQRVWIYWNILPMLINSTKR